MDKKKDQLDIILESVQDTLSITIRTEKGVRGDNDETDAKKIYYYLSRKLTAKPLKLIGAKINKPHDTVLHGIKRCKEHLMNEKDFQEKYHLCLLDVTKKHEFFLNKLKTETAEKLEEQADKLLLKVVEIAGMIKTIRSMKV